MPAATEHGSASELHELSDSTFCGIQGFVHVQTKTTTMKKIKEDITANHMHRLTSMLILHYNVNRFYSV